MYIKKSFPLCEFRPWCGAVKTWEQILENGKLDDLDELLSEIYTDDIDETTLNDLLWFERNELGKLLDMPELLDD